MKKHRAKGSAPPPPKNRPASPAAGTKTEPPREESCPPEVSAPPAEEEILKIKQVQLDCTAFLKKQLPKSPLPKIIFMGRSNVGKSSLINKLMNRKRLAKTSSRPGKTLSINYYLVNEQFYLVDLPGYGYAKAPMTEVKRVRRLMTDFFSTVENVKLLVILVDSRRGFMDSDLQILGEILNKGFKMLTVLTKSDKLRNSELSVQKKTLQTEFGLKVATFSVKSEAKKLEILKYINLALME